MRLFIASKVKIKKLNELKKSFGFIKAKWVEEENTHLTHLFLGDKFSLEEAIFRLKELKYQKKSVKLHSIGTFGKPPKVLFVKAHERELNSIYRELSKRFGYKIKPYKAHVTLARIKRVENSEQFYQKIKELDRDFGDFEIDMALISSTLTPNGPIYNTEYKI
jgi:2'-5' RNA ligase